MIKNRGNELKDLLQRQGITEIATSKRTHFRAEKAVIGSKRSGFSSIVGGRLAVPWRERACAIRVGQALPVRPSAENARSALECGAFGTEILRALPPAFKKMKNRGNELKDLLQTQGINEIATAKRTHFRAEMAVIGAERRGISRIDTARRPLA